tara:strand:- start:2824 stop:4557 length:1734 start_codon:yes stop_codon:yes gene_type:complete
MKNLFPSEKRSRSNSTSRIKVQHEQGITLVMALMLGMALMTGISGLLARQLMSRRLSAKESYQQMAESAANNGLNRILGELNNPNPNQNRGFLFTLDNRENLNEANNGFHWQRINSNQPPLFSEVCLDTSIGLPQAPNNRPSEFWPTTEVALENTNSPSMRDDGISKIETFYRLRGYSSPGTSGSTDSGEAKFIIEGLVRRKGAAPNSYLARSRLERSLYIQSWVDAQRSNDWAMLAAHHFELGPVELNSSGQVLWHTSKNNIKAVISQCNSASLVKRLGGSERNTPRLASRIWPVLDQKQPTANIFSVNGSKDTIPGRPDQIRVWRIDDDNYNPSWQCRWRVLCQRSSQDNTYTAVSNINSRRRWERVNGSWQPTATIRLRANDICTGKAGDCHVFIDRINLSRSKLLIENSSRPVVLHLLGPGSGSNLSNAETAAITLGNNALICGVDANSNTCNQRPERLVIITEAAEVPAQCSSNNHRINLSGNSLPAAMLLMRNGTVSLRNDTTLRGMIWSHSFCSNNHRLVLSAETQGNASSTLMQKASDLWQWSRKGFSGYGRRITRGIRGTGLDQFQRF